MSGPEKYERLVKLFLEATLSESLGSVAIFGSKKYLGKSGHRHQIDVSAEFRVAGLKFLVLVECKCYSRKVGVDEVMEFASRIEDVGAHKGILVSTVGFQDGAATFAASKGIALVIVCDLGWFPQMESPVAGAERHQEFVAAACKMLQELMGPEINLDRFNTALNYVAELDVTSARGLVPRPFWTLRNEGWGIRFCNVSPVRHGFKVEGADDQLVLDCDGLLDFVAIQFDCLSGFRLNPRQTGQSPR